MVYKSPVQNIYYQGTSGGRPNTPRTNELEQVANALSNFEQNFRSFGKSYVNNKQKVAQDVFEQLKAVQLAPSVIKITATIHPLTMGVSDVTSTLALDNFITT